MAKNSHPTQQLSYLDMQAEVGISKHIGGLKATDELLALCHIEKAKEVLNVGCGVGAGVAYIARRFPCKVVGVDISEKMISWSRLRAREEKVAERVEFKVADILALPFNDDRFDAVIVESVLAFVEDKPRALRECIRVTKPGGFVGLNESFWMNEPSAEMIALVRDSVGDNVPMKEVWQELWETSGLQERTSRIFQVEARSEMKERLRWLGTRWVLKGFGRLMRLYFTNPGMRQFMKTIASRRGLDSMLDIGYGLFSGRKAG
jgi:arsenite methyltransferase